LKITSNTFIIEQSIFWFKFRASGKIADIQKVELGINLAVNDQPVVTEIMLRHGVKTHKFGVGLSAVEKDWLLSEIIYFLENVKKIEPA
jgi:hypothetical protein